MQVCKVCFKDVKAHVPQVKRCDVETFVKQIERYLFFQQVIFSITGAARGGEKKEEATVLHAPARLEVRPEQNRTRYSVGTSAGYTCAPVRVNRCEAEKEDENKQFIFRKSSRSSYTLSAGAHTVVTS